RARAHRLWEWIAAKEAARRLWKAEGRPATHPADLAFLDSDGGRPRLTHVDRPEDASLAAIAIAHTDGVAVALAAREPASSVGIDVKTIADCPDDFESSASSPGERAILARWAGPARVEWIARLSCAKEAAARA